VSISPNDPEHEDRPKSPWTPSYSVTIQGSAAQDSDLDQLEQLPPSTGGFMDEPAIDSAGVMTTYSIPTKHVTEADNMTSEPTPIEVTAQPRSQLQGALLDEPEVTKDEPEVSRICWYISRSVRLVYHILGDHTDARRTNKPIS
jgi:hypothetical protein